MDLPDLGNRSDLGNLFDLWNLYDLGDLSVCSSALEKGLEHLVGFEDLAVLAAFVFASEIALIALGVALAALEYIVVPHVLFAFEDLAVSEVSHAVLYNLEYFAVLGKVPGGTYVEPLEEELSYLEEEPSSLINPDDLVVPWLVFAAFLFGSYDRFALGSTPALEVPLTLQRLFSLEDIFALVDAFPLVDSFALVVPLEEVLEFLSAF